MAEMAELMELTVWPDEQDIPDEVTSLCDEDIKDVVPSSQPQRVRSALEVLKRVTKEMKKLVLWLDLYLQMPERTRRMFGHFGGVEAYGDSSGQDAYNVRYSILWKCFKEEAPPGMWRIQYLSGLEAAGNVLEGILGIEWLWRHRGDYTYDTMRAYLEHHAPWGLDVAPAAAMFIMNAGDFSSLMAWRRVMEIGITAINWVIEVRPDLFEGYINIATFDAERVYYNLESLAMGHHTTAEHYDRGVRLNPNVRGYANYSETPSSASSGSSNWSR